MAFAEPLPPPRGEALVQEPGVGDRSDLTHHAEFARLFVEGAFFVVEGDHITAELGPGGATRGGRLSGR